MATNGVQDDTTPVDQPEEEEEEHDEIGEEVDLAALGVTDQPIKKKKKRKKNKPKSKRGLVSLRFPLPHLIEKVCHFTKVI